MHLAAESIWGMLGEFGMKKAWLMTSKKSQLMTDG